MSYKLSKFHDIKITEWTASFTYLWKRIHQAIPKNLDDKSKHWFLAASFVT